MAHYQYRSSGMMLLKLVFGSLAICQYKAILFSNDHGVSGYFFKHCSSVFLLWSYIDFISNIFSRMLINYILFFVSVVLKIDEFV